MPNHFHLLIRVRKNIIYKYSKDDIQSKKESFKSEKEGDQWFYNNKWETINENEASDNMKIKMPVPHRHFSHLFNAYTRYFNKRSGGTGNLFERPFKRKMVDNRNYLKMLTVYIHNNPVHHGFCSHPLEYPWSGYLSCISKKPTRLNRKEVIGLFGNTQNFIAEHNANSHNPEFENWLNLNTTDYVTENKSFNANLSAFAEPDNVKVDSYKIRFNKFNADLSGDEVRLKKVERSANLSAFAEPDNVKKDK
jgi:hypothetical protein